MFRFLSIMLVSLWSSIVLAQLPRDIYTDPEPQALRFVDSLYNTLTTRERVAQMIFVASGEYGLKEYEVKKLAEARKIGGIIFLGGTAAEFKTLKKSIDASNGGFVPLLYSLDAEPSLIKYKLRNVGTFAKTNSLKTKSEVDSVVKLIDSMLFDIGITVNYAPVCDLSPENEVIGHRSFGKTEDTVVVLSKEFVQSSLRDGVLPVIKHFPGHGYVQGDSHKKLVYIDGELTELNTFRRLINWGAPSVMVGHIAIKNHALATEMPSSCSREIVSGLLRDSLGFQGLIITDALNMGAVSSIEKASFLAMEAGCDIILMPLNVDELIELATKKIKEDEIFALQIEASVKRILLLKHLQGLVN